MNLVWFEWTAAIITALCVYLQARENIWNWPTAIVSVLMYAFIYIKSGLYSDAGLQLYFLLTSIYGWVHWLRGGVGSTELLVSRTSARTWSWCLVLGGLFYAADGWFASRLPGVAFPYIDAFTTTVSLIAQWMITRKLLESWLLWVLVNIVYVPMLISKHLYPTAGLYAFMLGLAVKGYVDWRKSYRSTRAAPLPASPATA